MTNYYDTFKAEIQVVDAELQKAQDELRNAENPADSIDLASVIEGRNFMQTNIRRLISKKSQLENAAQRVLTGEFGLCEDCGVDIPHQRLLLRPEATLCVECQSHLEANMRHRRAV